MCVVIDSFAKLAHVLSFTAINVDKLEILAHGKVMRKGCCGSERKLFVVVASAATLKSPQTCGPYRSNVYQLSIINVPCVRAVHARILQSFPNFTFLPNSC